MDTQCEPFTSYVAAAARAAPGAAGPKALFGLDGYIDTLYTVVRSRETNGMAVGFQTLEEFLRPLCDQVCRSADREVIVKSRRAGGNAPLTAHCLSKLGFYSRCMGLMGEGTAAPVFAEMARHSELISLGPPAASFSLEFSDGKLMFGELEELRGLTLERLRELVPEGTLVRYLSESRILSFLNWAGTPHLTEILRYLAEGPLGQVPLRGKTFFFDFSDIRTRTPKEFCAYLDVVTELARRVQVVVSVNENEAEAAAEYCSLCRGPWNLLGQELRRRIGVQELIIHMLDGAWGFTGKDCAWVNGSYITHPAITTGGGDNFNGGLCAGILMNLPLRTRLMLANATSTFYVTCGYSGTLEEVLSHFDRHHNEGKERAQ